MLSIEEGLFVTTSYIDLRCLIDVCGNQQVVGVHGHIRFLVNTRGLPYMVSQI